MGNNEKARYDQSYYDRIYQEVIHINDEEVVTQFMGKQMQNPEDALAYLSQWDHGDGDGEKLTYSQIMEGLTHVNYVSNDIYLALWQTGIDGISLYRVSTEEKSNNEGGSQGLSDKERFIISEGLLSLMHNIYALRAVLLDEEVNKALDAYITKIKRLNDKICLEMD